MTKHRTVLLASTVLAGPARAGALDATVDNLDNIPEALHSEYVQQGDKYVLQVNGMKPEADFNRVQTALTNERKDHSTLKGKIKETFGDTKFEDVRATLDRVPELEALAEGKVDDDKINSIVEGRVKTRLAPVERERDTLKTQLTEKDQVIAGFTTKERTRTISDAARAAAKSAKMLPEAEDDFLLLADRVFEVREDDGKVVVKDNVGFTPGIEPAVLLTDLQSKRPHWWGTSAGGGAGGSNGAPRGGDNPWTHDRWNLTEQGRIYSTDPAKAEQLAKQAGHASALGVTKPAKK
jgi:hypothetical protein